MIHSRRTLLKAGGALSLASCIAPSFAQARFPSRPVKLIVPFAPGGLNDYTARVLAPGLGEALGQSVVVENVAGAGGAIGAVALKRAEPNGYTALIHSNTLAIQPNIVKEPGYDIHKDFEPVSLLLNGYHTVLASNAVPARNFPEFLEFARKKGRDVFFGSAGAASGTHLAGEIFNGMAGTKMTHIAYKGSGALLQALIAGDIHVAFDTIPVSKPLHVGGKAKILALAGPKRNAGLPDIPTVSESGVPGYESAYWLGIFLPRGAAAPVVQQWVAALRKSLEAPDTRKRLDEAGLEVVGSGPEQLAEVLKADLGRYSKVIAQAGIKGE